MGFTLVEKTNPSSMQADEREAYIRRNKDAVLLSIRKEIVEEYLSHWALLSVDDESDSILLVASTKADKNSRSLNCKKGRRYTLNLPAKVFDDSWDGDYWATTSEGRVLITIKNRP